MRNVISLVLGGGRGTRLYPLTKFRSKPAVPLGGKYRLIDIPLSNCINSGLNRMYVVTQFNSVSLHRHIRRTYSFDAYSGGFVEILAAQQTIGSETWYQGTADAVRQNLRYLLEPEIDYVLILSGDQLYRMNYADMLKTHLDAKADVTIAAMPVTREAAKGFGVMKGNDEGQVTGFVEKPQTDEAAEPVRVDPAWIDSRGISSNGRDLLGSMGIYLFNRNVLVDLLENYDFQDFGKEVFPASISSHKVQMHLFDGYWEDIGTIKAFYECNLQLAQAKPEFELASASAPIYTRARFLPPTHINGATVKGSLLADGCTVGEGTIIENSVIGLRCRIGKNTVIRNSVIMGCDYYQEECPASAESCGDSVPMGIGDNTVIDGAIVDKNCRIGRNVTLTNKSNIENSDENERFMICDGIVMVQKGTTLPNGWKSE